MEVLTGLPTTGSPLIVPPDERPVTDICEQWLGAGVLLADQNGDHVQVHLLQLIGDPMVASTCSWGSAVLAWLYKVMGRAAFFSAGSMRGTGDIGGFTLLVELWALERFPRNAERYIQGGLPPPPPPQRLTPFRGAFAGYLSLSGISIRWPCTWRIYVMHSTCVWILWLGFLSFYLCKFEQFFLLFPYNNNVFPLSSVDVVRRPHSGFCVGWRCIVAVRYTLVVHRLHCMAPS
ncbi:hypothetical protein LINPERPRIM_LOCUS38621 [Linum perenne]